MSFLCGHCKRVMCSDCIEIADEYDELYQKQKAALITAQMEVERLTAENKRLARRVAMLEEVAKAGVGDIIGAWIDDNFRQLLKG